MTFLNGNPDNKLINDLLIPQVATASIEFIINKALNLNKSSVAFTNLAQKTLTVELAELPFTLCFSVNTGVKMSGVNSTEIIVRTQAEHSDCSIQTSLKTLKKIQEEQSLTELIKQDELNVIGDIKIAQQFATIAQSLEIDWQSELAKHIGDIPTHKLLHFSNKITKSLSAKGKQLKADVGEYLVHEKRLVVTNSQINTFIKQTQAVENQVDNLSKRIDALIEAANRCHRVK